MRQVIPLFAVLLTAQITSAQSTFKATVKDQDTKAPVVAATIRLKDSNLTATTDNNGVAELANIPNGEQTIEVFAVGYETKSATLVFPLTDQSDSVFFIKVTAEFGEVTISTTRTGREIDDVPTRVEAIDEEEVDEKISMRPANVSMVLNESTGIKVQQTSAVSNSQSVRIQGLAGRHTQILKDGFPAFGGFSGSLSVLDIPPLDLKQVEIIKGPSATFYGGGAIAGVVNFVSREPAEAPVTSLIFNQTSALGTDFSVFNSRKFRRFGYTLLGSINYQKEYDVDHNDFTELPLTKSFNLSPRLFFYLDGNSRITIGNSTSYQNRQGGDVVVIAGHADNFHQYFENNKSFRNITTFQFERDLAGGRRIVARQSVAFFDRGIEIPNYRFAGKQLNSYTDVSYFHPLKNHALVFGLSSAYDNFTEDEKNGRLVPLDESRLTFGAYLQDSFTVSSKLSLEAGFRVDQVRNYGTFPLPRVSALYRFNDKLSSRISFGFGYISPTVFTEEAEMLLFQNVLPIGNSLKAERSGGGTFDVNYRSTIGEKFSYSLNQMFFYTRIQDPLVLLPLGASSFGFRNAQQPVKSAGFETNLRASYYFAQLFAGYTFTNAKADYLAGNQTLPLTPRSRINASLILEKEKNIKAGVEAYYTSSQVLTNGSRTRPFSVWGIFGEKTFGKYSLFVNAENITDTRQDRFGPVVFPPHQSPTFAEIYTHTEGRVFNGGIKIKL